MNQGPITKRFLEAYTHLINEQKVRSGRQFAISIDAYPQSFNDIKKGRREATLDMVQNLINNHNVSAKFIMSGIGPIMEIERNRSSLEAYRSVLFIQAHQYVQYACNRTKDSSLASEYSYWSLPGEIIGNAVSLAIQCNTNSVAPCLSKGDILFARPVPRVSWKSNLSSHRIYIFVLEGNIELIRIDQVDRKGVFIRQDDRELPAYLSFEDIVEVWIPTSKWSSHVLKAEQNRTADIDLKLKQQGEQITLLNATLEKWMKQQVSV